MKYIKELNIDFNNWDNIEENEYDKYFDIFVNQINHNFIYFKINLYVNIDIFKKFKKYLIKNNIKINIMNDYLYIKRLKIKKFYIYLYNVDDKKIAIFYPKLSSQYFKTINLID